MEELIFSKRLKEMRQKMNLTQKELADQIGATATTISSYESLDPTKRKSPSLENAVSMAKALNVSLDWLSGLSSENVSNIKATKSSFVYLSDILSKIVEICDLNVNIRFSTDYSYETPRATIDIFGDEVISFADSWAKILSLYKDGTITKEMRDEWVKGAISKYSDFVVMDNGDIMPDSSDLPF